MHLVGRGLPVKRRHSLNFPHQSLLVNLVMDKFNLGLLSLWGMGLGIVISVTVPTISVPSVPKTQEVLKGHVPVLDQET